MTHIILLTILVFSLACAVYAWDPFLEISNPDKWYCETPGESLMFSGADPGWANKDSGNLLRIEPAGASFQEGDWVLAEMHGPGAITRMWFTGKDKQGKGPRIFGRLQIFIDSANRPVIDIDFEDFFGKSYPFVPPLAQTTSGGHISYVPIPFSKYCKVVVTDHRDRYTHRVNGLGQTIPHMYYQINWRKLPEKTRVEPFSLPLNEKRKKLLAKAATALLPNTIAELGMKTSLLDPRQSKTVFDQSGAGCVREVQFISDDCEDFWLKVYCDGKSEPDVNTPVKDFFAAGLSADKYASYPFSYDGSSVYTCRFPMPFECGIRIELENRSNVAKSFGLGIRVDNEPVKTAHRFKAKWLDFEVPEGPPDYLVLERRGSSGKFVGMALTLPHHFLEGNETFVVDGRKPGWTGTGTEDYFNGGWYFCFGPYSHAFSGCTRKAEDYLCMFRFHLLDAVTWKHNIRATLQHGGNNEIAGRVRGVAYWYEAR